MHENISVLACVALGVNSGQVYRPLQVVEGSGPTVAVVVAGKVGLYIDNRLQRGFVLVCSDIDCTVNKAGIVCKVFLVGGMCDNKGFVNTVVALVEQCHARADTVVAHVNVGGIRIEEIRTFLYVGIRNFAGNVAVIVVVWKILRSVIP